MKNWVIAGMGTFILQSLIVISHFIIQWWVKGGATP
jgi:hypothetical protein